MGSDNNSTSATAETKPQLSFKEQLDLAAFEARNPDAGKPQPSIVDKVTETVTSYIPPLGKVLNKTPTPESSSSASSSSDTTSKGDAQVLPVRPDHDTQIEQFIQDQHRSKTNSGDVVT